MTSELQDLPAQYLRSDLAAIVIDGDIVVYDAGSAHCASTSSPIAHAQVSNNCCYSVVTKSNKMAS